MKIYEDWIRAHLPPEVRGEALDVFGGFYLDGLTVLSGGERGGADTVVFRAENEEELRYWQLELLSGSKNPPSAKRGAITGIMPRTVNGFTRSAAVTTTTR